MIDPSCHDLPIGAPDHLPRLGEVIRDAERLSAQLISVLNRDYDLDSAPTAEDDPTGLGFVEVRLMSARADARSALAMLEQITAIGLPPAGSAVQFPARQSTNSASLPGGPSDHLADASAARGGLQPGLVVASAPPRGDDESPTVRQRRRAGESSRGFTLPPTQRFTMPGTAAIARSVNEALDRRSR
jgi:hypothetical protein